jgi:hypothetical protein
LIIFKVHNSSKRGGTQLFGFEKIHFSFLSVCGAAVARARTQSANETKIARAFRSDGQS